jgi:L-rhamnose mutarotase
VKVGLRTRLKPGAEARYEEYHAHVWPEVVAGMRKVGIRSWVIFRDGLDLFHCVECEDYDRAMASLHDDPLDQRWQAEMAPLMAVGHDLSGSGSDRLKLIFDLDWTPASS